MARVTKINVGGTNYDIAHEGELKNSGFEVVTSLPTTGLFEGREVVYQGKKYVYSSGWKEEITANTMYEDKLLWGRNSLLGTISPIDVLIRDNDSCNMLSFVKSDGVSIEYSRDGGNSWVDYGLTPEQKNSLFMKEFSVYCGKSANDGLTANSQFLLRITIDAVNIRSTGNVNKTILWCSSTGSGNWCTVSALTNKNYNDGNVSDDFFVVEYNKIPIGGGIGWNVLNFPNVIVLSSTPLSYRLLRYTFGCDDVSSGFGLYINRLIVYSYYMRLKPSNITKYGHLYDFDYLQNALFPAKVESQEIINFNINNIEPTQTGNVTKTSTWLWQYLVQGINWLKANDVRVSDTKLDKRAYNQIYTNCGYTNIVSSTTGALIIELPFAPNGDANNSMTYIELNVYSHRKGCSKYIIGIYSFSQNSQYEWSAYSYMGYNYFSKISFGRRRDNNNIVVVLGDFTDLHKHEHFSINNIITGYNRNNDDTDGFLLYTDSNSNNYNTLISSTYISPIISYNDLTDTPTLAAVATSGSYNDLTDKPTFSGSYNDLTDKPTLFSGSYNDLTDTPNLATVATSGNYDDLLNKPALVFSNIGGTISSVQIPDGLIANGKLANSSMSLNDTTVNLGDTAILPWYVDYNETDYPARIRDHWLQIYRNGVWANLMYLGDILPTQVGQITSLDNLDWYNEQVSEYEVDSNTTQSILAGTTLPATLLLNCLAEQLTLNLYPISGKEYGKGSLDSLITDLQGKGFSVFVENDLDAILSSGSDYLVRLKISKLPTPKAIIECYVAK